ncbi:hypothetical protein A2Z00_02805 [Candidatus Gottesmanbacteria bacterium RBG_13_45_10]|uniref:Radical SAM core domain-containing protein n=1 Tax=Candidatus Gottesmanbacteria bacterium RBG_13_45_10 TaxID=1798370 RepID=A0A1F5ZGS4_9BACT|nr:MAG: hypothetical protein A2Z00_02805 [Candidatus Gottesmanbacteria bacterium RBG_13_45_10]
MSVQAEYVGYRVTEGCNAGQACRDRCFSREGGTTPPDPSIDEVRLSLWTLREAGIRAVNLMGGEPTTRDDIVDIARFAHDIGLRVILTTNTIALTKERLDELAPYLDWLSVSIEADNQRVNDGLRGRGQLAAVTQVIGWIGEENYPFHLKVNTQVTAQNMRHIDNIPHFFCGNVEIWKLLQWTPRGDAKKVMSIYAVSPEQYEETVRRERSLHPGLHIVERPYPEIDPDTVILRPGGDLEVNAGPDYVVVGNILTEDARDVLAQAGMIYSRLNVANRMELNESYPSWSQNIANRQPAVLYPGMLE